MLTFVDLFCGGGFGARGAVNAGARPLLGVDAWDLATATYKHNFNCEVRTATIEELIEDGLDKLSKQFQPDVLLTSPECTSHSIARGSRPGCEKSKETAIGIIPWLEAMQPRWLIVENVTRMSNWDRHAELIQDIESYGYTVSELRLNAADFGAPQARKRMFLLCDSMGSSVTSEELYHEYGQKFQPARSVIDWSGKYKSTPLYKTGRARATLARAERAMSELGRGKSFIIVYYGSDYAGGWQSLDAPLRTITTLDRFGLVTWSEGEPYLRMLQPDELLSAMGAPTHEFPSGINRRNKVKLCGNGVCSPVTEMIFRKINAIQAQELSKAS